VDRLYPAMFPQTECILHVKVVLLAFSHILSVFLEYTEKDVGVVGFSEAWKVVIPLC
jgi:hypothetical protein